MSIYNLPEKVRTLWGASPEQKIERRNFFTLTALGALTAGFSDPLGKTSVIRAMPPAEPPHFSVPQFTTIRAFAAYGPTQLVIRPAEGATLFAEHGGRKSELRKGALLHLKGAAKVTGPYGSLGHFWLSVPGHAEREYFGRLEVQPHAGRLIPLVEMDLETAVAAIVDAEGTEGLPMEARRAQAVATRSYLLAARGKRHVGYDFCDMEHCQLLKTVADVTSPACQATRSTRGQVLTYRKNIVAALYSANCGGHTRNLYEAGWQGPVPPGELYPFFGVTCPMTGPVSGHRVGMCQLGAIAIAKQGKPADVILGHYFPRTTIGMVELA